MASSWKSNSFSCCYALIAISLSFAQVECQDVQFIFNAAKTKCARIEPASEKVKRPVGGSEIPTPPASVNTKELCAKACVEFANDECKMAVFKEINPKGCILYHFNSDDLTTSFIPPNDGERFSIATVVPFDQCPVSSTSTTTTTATTVIPTTDNPECKDTNTKCQKWASEGQCDSNPFFVRVECPRTCNKCEGFEDRTIVNACGDTYDPARPQCPNNNERCNFWATIGDCTRNADWMLPNCCAACEKLTSVLLKNCPLSQNAPYNGEGLMP